MLPLKLALDYAQVKLKYDHNKMVFIVKAKVVPDGSEHRTLIVPLVNAQTLEISSQIQSVRSPSLRYDQIRSGNI